MLIVDVVNEVGWQTVSDHVNYLLHHVWVESA